MLVGVDAEVGALGGVVASRPYVFSFVPRRQGEWESQK